MLCVFCSGRFVSSDCRRVGLCRSRALRARDELCGRLRCVVSSACFAECSRWSRASQLGPYKVPYVALANSKEHESNSHKSPPRRTCVEALRYCWPRDKPVRRAREFSLRDAERTRIQLTVQGPPAGPWGAPAVSRARATPDGSPWSRPRMGAGEKRPSTTAISSTLIAIGWLFALREDSAGSSPETASSMR